MIKNKKGFTLIELLVVIAIIGLLSTLAVVALNNARQKSRDAKRVADVKQMQTALELYYNDCSGYPVQAAANAPLTPALQGAAGTPSCDQAGEPTVGTFLATVPTAPTPFDGTNCGAAANGYYYQSTDPAGAACDGSSACASYAIQYCLGATTGSITGNEVRWATPSGM
jgi:prepilin-type N-terminal cleavage/methylation domain-containing protein